MTLIVATELRAAATPRDLEELGINTPALQAIPLAKRLRTLQAAMGELAPYLRKRYALPLVPTLRLSSVDTSGMIGGASVVFDGGPASLVQDLAVKFAVVGPAITYQINPYAGAYGSAYGAAIPLVAQSLALDGYALTIVGAIADADVLTYSTAIVQDPGVALANARLAAWVLLHARGVDAKTEADVKAAREAAVAWGKSLGSPGEGELATDGDRTPLVDEYGPLGRGQQTPYEWLDDPSRLPS